MALSTPIQCARLIEKSSRMSSPSRMSGVLNEKQSAISCSYSCHLPRQDERAENDKKKRLGSTTNDDGSSGHTTLGYLRWYACVNSENPGDCG
ncbi:hypothetical protein WG66_007466 [Moniliophthora roreri]|nr:hypothetical protein WG66_005914 [Moniliophthora roreri]KAI3617939.1 hypothetical protein WG66_007466 [Moniliophthora roreri]